MGSFLCFDYFFLFKFLRIGEKFLLIFERTGDQNIPAIKLDFNLPRNIKKGDEYRGVSI